MFTEEQTKAIAEIVSKAISSTQAPAAKPADEVRPVDEEAKKSIAQQAKDQIEAEKAQTAVLTQVQNSIKFNLSISDFVEKNKALLPEEAGKILTTISSKTFKNEDEKANTVRKSLLDSFLSQQENIDCLTVSLSTRANEYKGLAESEKEKRSSEFWDLAEVGIALKAGVRKAQALNKINGVNAGEDSKNIIASKILTLAKERFQPTKL